MSLKGYHGRYLRIDASTRTAESVALDSNELRSFIGGVGLGAAILLREVPAEVEAFDAEAALAFVFSPLVGSPLTTSAKFAVCAKSPLTNRFNDSLSSSHFAIAGRKTGYDAIVIRGQCDGWSVIVIDDGAVSFVDADSLLGKTASDAATRFASQSDRGFRTAFIGPAGENLVRYATISHDRRHAGRGGMGAVLGSKRIKGIAVRGNATVEWARPGELVEYARALSRKSFGPATEKYRELGTVSNLLTFNRLGVLPTRNFQQSTFADAEQLAPDSMDGTGTRTRASCAACTIGCEHIFTTRDNSQVRMEYENLFALGPLCGISDADAVLRASQACDHWGLDTISAGGTIAFAMECAENGLIESPGLEFGSVSALLSTIAAIGSRDGIGNLLAEGSRRAAETIGQGSDAFAPHVKGLEIPGYEPRALQTMALGFAVGTRGADHNRSGAYQADFSESIDRFRLDASAVQAAIATENEAAVMDSLILCKFLRGVFDERMQAMADMLRLVTGFEYSPDDLQRVAHGIVEAKKRFNIQHGWTPAEDTLPKRFLSEAIPEGGSAGAVIDSAALREAILNYNRARGWSDEGWLT